MIYVLDEDDNSAVKIGSSSSSGGIRKRVIQIGIGNPRRLRLVAVADGCHADEKRLHRQFGSARVHGEWFSRSDDVLRFVAEHAIAPLICKRGMGGWPKDEIGEASEFKLALDAINDDLKKKLRDREEKRDRVRTHRCSTCHATGHNTARCPVNQLQAGTYVVCTTCELDLGRCHCPVQELVRIKYGQWLSNGRVRAVGEPWRQSPTVAEYVARRSCSGLSGRWSDPRGAYGRAADLAVNRTVTPLRR